MTREAYPLMGEQRHRMGSEGVNWIDLAHNTWALVNKGKNLSVSSIIGSSLTSLATISFSSLTLLRGVSRKPDGEHLR
jgi:hypothetical protein